MSSIPGAVATNLRLYCCFRGFDSGTGARLEGGAVCAAVGEWVWHSAPLRLASR